MFAAILFRVNELALAMHIFKTTKEFCSLFISIKLCSNACKVFLLWLVGQLSIAQPYASWKEPKRKISPQFGPIPKTFHISFIRRLVSEQREPVKGHKVKAYLLERTHKNKVSLHYQSWLKQSYKELDEFNSGVHSFTPQTSLHSPDHIKVALGLVPFLCRNAWAHASSGWNQRESLFCSELCDGQLCANNYKSMGFDKFP